MLDFPLFSFFGRRHYPDEWFLTVGLMQEAATHNRIKINYPTMKSKMTETENKHKKAQ